ncbi:MULTISPECIES: AAA family ATPase [Kribbella]|uniref:ATP-binding protein n=1 Tax=Kribbella TaxID=182639 RepID=UPI0018EE6548|nr:MULTISPECIES: LuxR family transcriptional regulator [Kribbella]
MAERQVTQLFGRERELAVLSELFEDLGGHGGALVITGEVGIGKSALLSEARRRAEQLGMSVLSTSGAPFEAQMPFAGLQRLLWPVMQEVSGLPEPQRAALSVALGVSGGPTPDTFLVALAALNVVADRAGEAPLLLVVENVRWLDAATRDVLAFMARRVETEPIVFLLAVRDGYATFLDDAGLRELRLETLDDASAKALLDAGAPRLDSELRRRVLNEAGGNPLALVELPRALDSKERGGLSTTAPLPLTPRLERAFAGRVSELPAATRSLLLVAALDEGAGLNEILAAASLVEHRTVTVDDLAPAEAAGLVSVNSERLMHPLVRAAISSTAAVSVRQAAHQALAETCAADPERSVWHRAAELTGPDEEVAADLTAAAERALRQGAPAWAAAALERAAQLTELASSRGHLLVRAAEIEFELGRSDLARRHVAEAKALELGQEDRTQLTFMLDASDQDSWSSADGLAALAELASEMTTANGPAPALKSLLTVALGCWWGNPTQETRDLVVAAVESLPVAEDDPARLAVLAWADPVKQGAFVIDRIAQLRPDATGDPVALHLLGAAASAVWAFDLALGFLTSSVDGLRAQGRFGLLAQALVAQSWAAIHLAKETLALSAADEAARLARETGQSGWALAADLAIAVLAGERGDSGIADALADRAEKELLPIGPHAMLSLVQFARGRDAIAQQRYSIGFEHLRRILDPRDIAYHPFVGAWALADLVEAAACSGNIDKARLYLEQLESLAAATSGPFLRATLSYARPLLSPDDKAEELYQAALSADLSDWPCYRGRLLLNYGRWLRHQGRVADSRAPLRAAWENLDALAFGGLAEAARQELRASGETSMPRTPDERDRLTPQELHIAQLAARGLSNREIGRRLYLSHRTIGSHLYRLFPKLGISSRSELAGVLSTAVPDELG